MKLKTLLLAAIAACGSTAFGAQVIKTGQITANETWTANNTYLLNGYVFVTNGATLTIEPGTVVQGRVSSGTGAAALIITRGSRINAAGTSERPIIFTSELDQLNGNLTERDTGLWGGLVVLGRASINSRANGQVVAAPVEDQVEGFSVSGDQTGLITFGGTDDADNSGVLRYVSIRHGGAVIGTANEINGLTLGGVGSGTTIEYIEVFANKDDGFEWFGGTVNARYLVSAFNNDDAFDMDQGYRGNLQYLFGILGNIGTDAGDKGFEWDGATAPLTATPIGRTTVANATIIGYTPVVANSFALNIRDSVEATVINSVFVNFDRMLDVENDVDDGPNAPPSIKNTLFFSQTAANNTAAGLNARPTGTVDATAIIGDATNRITNPNLRAISYTNNRQLDPRPAVGSPALTGAGTVAGSGLEATTYAGAFNTSNWAAGWTKLWTDGYFSLSSIGDSSDGSVVPPRIPNSVGKPVNLSARGQVGTGGNVLIAGFVIGGTQTQQVLIRAVGPTLGAAPFNVPGVLADPIVTINDANNTVVASNDKWSANTAATQTSVGAFPLTANSEDAVVIVNLNPGAYTAVVSGKGGATGVALVEVYEVD